MTIEGEYEELPATPLIERASMTPRPAKATTPERQQEIEAAKQSLMSQHRARSIAPRRRGRNQWAEDIGNIESLGHQLTRLLKGYDEPIRIAAAAMVLADSLSSMPIAWGPRLQRRVAELTRRHIRQLKEEVAAACASETKKAAK